MKIGVIGIGDIAQKAYLPILAQTKGIEVCMCTRNKKTLHDLRERYRFTYSCQQVDQLISQGIHAAFVHSSTASHEAIIDQLLDHDIHVYVDKPITYNGSSSKRLIEKAQRKGLVLMVGFNRRYAPPYQSLGEIPNPNMILMKKNRGHHAVGSRTFIFDDFIHVIDTVLHLFPYQIEETQISGKLVEDDLHSVVIQLQAIEGIAIGIMNREAGTTEERLEVMNEEETRIVENVSEVFSHQNKSIQKYPVDDWEPTLHKRGFYAIVESFLASVRKEKGTYIGYEKDLKSHLLAEKIVNRLEKKDK
ncbi:Gfo/Idh/MocA family oxidoreductase [Radiobacillus kanasensis]|uniref:Gfo/Idh/MocA family protein n=1 Tax=Radiobacillus kanasensis TaxID=2844358 RepID=UPI001E4C81A8|nr:Gfo/Idh/MocA family oxidoreductase [Radiobacillus kanasensis]UFT99656.1 Gfo/Idh/MocA family oxidoreductase [Radiobacillus kanasensis]